MGRPLVEVFRDDDDRRLVATVGGVAALSREVRDAVCLNTSDPEVRLAGRIVDEVLARARHEFVVWEPCDRPHLDD